MSVARLAKASIKIPLRIERGPTDILKALASTVKHVPGEPELSIHDDPYLIPTKATMKRLYILSKLSGMRAAKFILNKHPDLFFRDDSEPKVESFLPREEFHPDMEFSEQDIKWCIENSDPVNGILAYNCMREKDIKLEDETLMQFFELLCYTNEENMQDYMDTETNRLVGDSDEKLVKLNWKTGGLASRLFEELKDKNPQRVYSVMIAGLCRYNEHQKAIQLFEKFKQLHQNMGLYQSAYCGLIRSIATTCSSSTTAYEELEKLTSHMEANLVIPNLEIFNSIFLVMRSFKSDESVCERAFKLLNDMKTLKIEPSLGTYASFIGILGRYKSGEIYKNIINDTLTHIDNNVDVSYCREDRDKLFLGSTMYTLANNLNNLNLANKLHRIYLKNPNLFLDAKFRTRYLNHYFKLIVTMDNLENILNFYKSYVPAHFQPTADTYEALTEALDLYRASDDVINKIGEDLIRFRVAKLVKNDGIYRKNPQYVEALNDLDTKYNK